MGVRGLTSGPRHAWRRLAGSVHTLAKMTKGTLPVTEKADLQSVLDRAAAGGRITPEEALDLYRDAPLPTPYAAAGTPVPSTSRHTSSSATSTTRTCASRRASSAPSTRPRRTPT